jgi:hypothetical protein
MVEENFSADPAIGSVPGAPAGLAGRDEAEVGIPGASRDGRTKDQLDFLWKVHGYTSDFIRFADAKAGTVIVISSGLIASLMSHSAHQHFRRVSFSSRPNWELTKLAILSASSFFLLGLAICFAVLAILPRLRQDPLGKKGFLDWIASLGMWVRGLLGSGQGRSRGMIFWGGVVAHRTREEYHDALAKADDQSWPRFVSDQVFVLSEICDEKFRMVNRSVIAGFLGGVLTGILLLFA